MKKIYLLILLLALTLLTGAGYLWFKKQRPPVETKFIQNEQRSESRTENGSDKVETVIYTIPGDNALVANNYHVYQTFNNCGPATLSMILSWWGRPVSQDELGDKMRPYQVASGDNDDKTIFTYEFVDWAEKYGYEAVGRVNGDINLLKTFTANGIPVIVKTWLHPNEDIGHFRIVTGFDEDKQVIIQDDSYEGPNRRISYFDFLSMWQPFNYDYIIVYPSEKAELVEAIIGEEIDENVAWENALERAIKEKEKDPENVYPPFNMSTAYYHLGDYQNSTRAFESVEGGLPKRMLWYQIEPVQAYQKLGEYDRVFEITNKVLENGNRAYSEFYMIRGEIYLEQDNIEAARQQFELAVKYNENFNEAKEALNSL